MKKRMILTMAAVICCLATVSLTANAVFRYSAQTRGISIQMADYAVKTEVQFVEAVTASTPRVAAFALDVCSEENDISEGDGGLEEPDISEENGSYKFPGHGTATFTLTPIGTAGEGYVVVTIEGKGTYYTGQISKDNNYIFSVTAEEGTVVKIESVWGKYNADNTDSNAEMQLIEQAAAIELVTAEELSVLTATPTPAPTEAPTISPSPSSEPTAEPTATPEATVEPTASPEAKVSPEATASPEVTPEPTEEPTEEPTLSPEATASPEPTASPRPEVTSEPVATASPTPSESPSSAPTVEPAMTPEVTEESVETPEPMI